MNDEMLTKTDVKARGWTDALIHKFLGDPDGTARNPRYRQKGAPVLLFLKRRVEAAETSEEFKTEMQKTVKRRAGAKAGVKTKRENIIRHFESLEIRLTGSPLEDVRREAKEAYDKRGPRGRSIRRDSSDEDDEFDEFGGLQETDADFSDRITVNYLRHKCTNYEAELKRKFGQVAREEWYPLFKKRVLDAIASRYPDLKEACESQKDGL